MSEVRELVDGVHENNDIIELRTMACDYGVKIIDMPSHMETLFVPQQANDIQLAFTLFDIAMVLCVALQRDGKRILPMRKRVLTTSGLLYAPCRKSSNTPEFHMTATEF